MSGLQSFILGIIQGLTEFLPISSSGHLVIIPNLLGWNISDKFIFDVLVQVATLIAVISYFWKDLFVIGKAMVNGLLERSLLANPDSRLGWMLLLSSIPAGLIGIILKDLVEDAFKSLVATGIALLITAMLLVIAENVGKRIYNLRDVSWFTALWIGFFQVIAIFPGVSRSGATISGGMTRDLKRPAAARFSFLMSIPIMLAAGLLEAIELINRPDVLDLLPVYIPGFVSAAVVGYLAIRWLIRYLQQHSLYIFVIYCALMGIISIVAGLLRT